MSTPTRHHPAVANDHGWLPKLLGLLVALGGVWSLVSIPLPRSDFADWVDDLFAVVGVPAGPSLFLALCLLITAAALKRGLRAAWVVALAVLALQFVACAIVAVSICTDSLDEEVDDITIALIVVTTIVTGAWLVLLVIRRKDFPARMRSGSLRRAIGTLLAGLLACIAVIFMLSWAAPGDLHGGEHLWFSIRSVTGISMPHGISDGANGPHWLAAFAGILAAGVLLLTVWRYTESAERSEV